MARKAAPVTAKQVRAAAKKGTLTKAQAKQMLTALGKGNKALNASGMGGAWGSGGLSDEAIESMARGQIK